MSRELISPEGLRQDGRRAKEVRNIECKLGLLTRVDGSALFQIGNTKIIASVYGPREASNRSKSYHDKAYLSCEYAMASFSTTQRKKSSKVDRRSKEIALLIKQTFESCILTQLFPRSQISIFIQVLQSDGGAISAAINATSLALINAGIPMKEFICASTAGFIDSTSIADLNYVERSSGSPELMVAIYPLSGNVATVQLDSKIPLANLSEVLKMATDGAKFIYEHLKESVKEYSFDLLHARGQTSL